jgi:hypothetical protein
MFATKLSNVGVVSILVLAATACSVRIGETSASPVEPTSDRRDSDASAPTDVNAQVAEVSVVGTSVTSAFRADGRMGITLLPRNAAHDVVLSNDLAVTVTVTSPSGISVESTETDCADASPTATSSAIGVILDDSSSMLENDPEMKRKSAAVSFLRALGPDDSAMLTDYGNSGLHLRDLVCATSNRHICSPAKPAFTRDKAQLIAAAAQIVEGPDGTPLYESCVEMVSIVDSVRDQHRGMLLLSDGQPTSMAQRDACHRAATTAKIPVFTVGLGPAAEADPKADAAAVKVLRELASETGGSYASANDPAQLDQLFANIGTALARGSCRTTVHVKTSSAIEPGTTISGEIRVGSQGAKAAFSLVAPAR